ncbi:hypothetical protein DSUL_50127 [Desulfovibrionales bacterium]
MRLGLFFLFNSTQFGSYKLDIFVILYIKYNIQHSPYLPSGILMLCLKLRLLMRR